MEFEAARLARDSISVVLRVEEVDCSCWLKTVSLKKEDSIERNYFIVIFDNFQCNKYLHKKTPQLWGSETYFSCPFNFMRKSHAERSGLCYAANNQNLNDFIEKNTSGVERSKQVCRVIIYTISRSRKFAPHFFLPELCEVFFYKFTLHLFIFL